MAQQVGVKQALESLEVTQSGGMLYSGSRNYISGLDPATNAMKQVDVQFRVRWRDMGWGVTVDTTKVAQARILNIFTQATGSYNERLGSVAATLKSTDSENETLETLSNLKTIVDADEVDTDDIEEQLRLAYNNVLDVNVEDVRSDGVVTIRDDSLTNGASSEDEGVVGYTDANERAAKIEATLHQTQARLAEVNMQIAEQTGKSGIMAIMGRQVHGVDDLSVLYQEQSALETKIAKLSGTYVEPEQMASTESTSDTDGEGSTEVVAEEPSVDPFAAPDDWALPASVTAAPSGGIAAELQAARKELEAVEREAAAKAAQQKAIADQING